MKLDMYKKARKQMGKETTKLGSVVRVVMVTEVPEEELAVAIKGVMEVTGMVSVAMFEGIGTSLGWRRNRWMRKGKKVENGILEFMEVSNNGDNEVKVRMDKMKDLEEWIGSIENVTEKLLRTLMNTRVSILNALSH